MFNKKQKSDNVEQIRTKLQKSNLLIIAEYQGMTVENLNLLRNRLRKESKSEYTVYKNTLFKLALGKDSPLAKDEYLTGPNGIVFSYGDQARTAKIVTEISEKNDKFKLKIGLMGDRILTRKDLEALSKLPSREVMLATLLCTMKAPISGMVNVCAGVIRGFVNCVNEVKKQKESQPQQA
ncbi:MAG: 50S ribosomal protein L10 [Candidatus Wallbacteria bacterium]|nr:50S ribosomal protein L10 [Candidatus Wallbacteria bacterium]